MIELLSLLGLLLGFFGLWMWVHRRIVSIEKRVYSQMQDSFKSASLDALGGAQASFLQLARNDLDGRQKVIETMLMKLDEQHRDIEKQRCSAYSSLHKQLDLMIASDRELRKETASLVQALRSPQIRGSWGQVHLRRVVELAGLQNQCDFFEQSTLSSDGKTLRPDLIVRLPGQRYIVVDAKTPLQAYLDAVELTEDEERRSKMLQEHASAVRKHIKDLSSKEYWKALAGTPDYVILFLPAEAFFSAALAADPSLIEIGAESNIVMATPTTLIAILRAIAFTWKQEGLSKSAAEIAKLGAELYDRLGTVTEYWGKVGKSLGAAVQAYNQSVVSLESRALVSARKLKDSAGIAKDLPNVEQLEQLVRE